MELLNSCVVVIIIMNFWHFQKSMWAEMGIKQSTLFGVIVNWYTTAITGLLYNKTEQ